MLLFQLDRELSILDPIAWVIAFKLHEERIRGSQALSITLPGRAPDESFLYGPSRCVEHIWEKIPQFHQRLVSWAGATEPPAHNKSMSRCPFQCGKDYYISKKYFRVLYMSFHFYRVVFCAPIPKGPRTPNFGSCSMSYSLKLHGKVFGALRPCLPPYRYVH